MLEMIQDFDLYGCVGIYIHHCMTRITFSLPPSLTRIQFWVVSFGSTGRSSLCALFRCDKNVMRCIHQSMADKSDAIRISVITRRIGASVKQVGRYLRYLHSTHSHCRQTHKTFNLTIKQLSICVSREYKRVRGSLKCERRVASTPAQTRQLRTYVYHILDAQGQFECVANHLHPTRCLCRLCAARTCFVCAYIYDGSSEILVRR